MRIGFMGSSGVGKTTLCDVMESAPAFAEYTFNRNVMARLKERGYPINEATTATTQTTAMKEFAYDLASCANAVNERTVLDCLAYTMTSHRLGRMTFEERERHRVAALHLAPLYDRIFYIEPEFPVQPNGLRLTEPHAYQIHVEMFRKVYEEARLTARITRITGSVGERLEQIEAALDMRAGSLTNPQTTGA